MLQKVEFFTLDAAMLLLNFGFTFIAIVVAKKNEKILDEFGNQF